MWRGPGVADRLDTVDRSARRRNSPSRASVGIGNACLTCGFILATRVEIL